MKTKLTLAQLRSADFIEIIGKDELESLIGEIAYPPQSCVFNCFDHIDGNAYTSAHYAYATQYYLGYTPGSYGQVNTDDIATIGSFGTMYVQYMDPQTDHFYFDASTGGIIATGISFDNSILCFEQNGLGHAVVAKGVTSGGQIKYYDPTNGVWGEIAASECYAIYGVSNPGVVPFGYGS